MSGVGFDCMKIRRLENALAAAQREVEDLKDLANGLLEFAKTMLPICPEKARKMIEYATEKGREMRSNATVEIERLREALEKIRTLPDQPAGLREVGDYAAIAKAALAGAGETEKEERV